MIAEGTRMSEMNCSFTRTVADFALPALLLSRDKSVPNGADVAVSGVYSFEDFTVWLEYSFDGNREAWNGLGLESRRRWF
jgi:hypothetical protein